MIKVCQIGLGRTGQYIAKGISKQKNMELVAAVCSPSSQKAGKALKDIITGILTLCSSSRTWRKLF